VLSLRALGVVALVFAIVAPATTASGRAGTFAPPGYADCGVLRVAWEGGGHGRYRVWTRHSSCRRARLIARDFYAGRSHLLAGSLAEYQNPHVVRGGWRCGVFAGGVGCFERGEHHPRPRLLAVLQPPG
jgi:hypothetical protein